MFQGQLDQFCQQFVYLESQASLQGVFCMELSQESTTLMVRETDGLTTTGNFVLSLLGGSCTCFSGYKGPQGLEEGGSDFINVSDDGELIPDLLLPGSVMTGKAYRLTCDEPPCAAVIAATSGFFGYSYFTAPDEDATCDEYTLVGQGVRTVSRECVEIQQQETTFIVYEPQDVVQDTVLTVSLESGNCICLSGYGNFAESLSTGDSDSLNLPAESQLLPEPLFSGFDIFGKSYEFNCASPPCSMTMVFTSGTPAWSYFTADEDLPCDDYYFVADGIRTSSVECIELNETGTMFFLYESTPGDAIAMTVSLSSGPCNKCYDETYQQPIFLEVNETSSLAVLANEAVVPLVENNGMALNWITYELACDTPPCYAAFESSFCLFFIYDLYEHSTSLPASCDDYTLVTDNATEKLCGKACVDLTSPFSTLLAKIDIDSASDYIANWTVTLKSGECPCLFTVDPIELEVGDIHFIEDMGFRVEQDVPGELFDSAFSESYVPFEIFCATPPCNALLTGGSSYTVEYLTFEHTSSLPVCDDYTLESNFTDSFSPGISLCVDLGSDFTTLLIREAFYGSNNLTVTVATGSCNCYDGFDPPITLGVGDSDTIP
eukprot:scaffold11622_cov179-Cylindrotheca_fusiformis.AAC.1